MSRPTIHDVAREANVSLATVDRVLNRRPGVRQLTIARVEAAVRKLHYVRDMNAANLARQRHYSLLFILPEGNNAFMRDLEAQLVSLQAYPSPDRTQVRVQTVPAFNATALANALHQVDATDIAGVAIVATEDPAVTAAVNRLIEQGVPVVTLVSDLPASRRVHYAGINNIAAGRTAASLLGRFLFGQRGKIVVIAGSMLLRDHVERHLGFMQVMDSEFPALDILPVLQGRDDAATVATLLTTCLQQHPDILGIYSLGAGNRGVIQALQAQRQDQPRHLRVVAHELTEYARTALHDGLFDVVLHQDAGHEVRSAVRVLKAHLDGHRIITAQERIRIDVFMRDNLP